MSKWFIKKNHNKKKEEKKWGQLITSLSAEQVHKSSFLSCSQHEMQAYCSLHLVIQTWKVAGIKWFCTKTVMTWSHQGNGASSM